jgi:hypothetical protein
VTWPHETAPDWVVAEMPPGYRNRIAEIQRLSDELRALDPLGRLLWSVGDDLSEAVRDAFVALGFEVEPAPSAAVACLTVKLDGGRRLLLRVSPTTGIVQKKDQDLGDVFQILRELAEDTDRVVFVANTDPQTRPADRPEVVESEALDLFRRLGVNVLAGQTMFALWMLSLQDPDRARTFVTRLHEQDGGTFVLPSPRSR